MLASNYEIGCPLLRRSMELDPRPGTTFTVAECYSRWGKFAAALELYDQYLALYDRMGPEERESQKQRAEVSRAERQKLLAKVPWLTIVLPDDAPPGTVVTMNDRPLSQNFLGVAMAVDPGSYVFTTRAPGGPLIGDQVVEMEPGARKRVTLDVRRGLATRSNSGEPVEAAGQHDRGVPQVAVASEDTVSVQRKWAWALTGIGIAGLAAGGVTGGILLDKKSIIDKECKPDPSSSRSICTEKGLDAANTAKGTYAPATTAALSAGAGLLATAVILFVTDKPQETPPVRASFGIGPRGATIHLTGRF